MLHLQSLRSVRAHAHVMQLIGKCQYFEVCVADTVGCCAQVLLRMPPGAPAPISDDEVAALCFPSGK